MKKKENRGKGKGKLNKRTLLIILCAVLAVILVLMIIGTAYMEKLMNLIGRSDGDDTISPSDYVDETDTMPSDFQGPVLNPDDIQWDKYNGAVEDAEHIINIMLIGQDRRPGEGRARSDVMILCSVNKKTQELTMTSFMRDMYVPIPGFWDDKMNAAYAVGGMEALDACLEKNFGVYVDGNVEVDFNGFIGVIDLVGGIEMELTASEARYMNNELGLRVDGSSGWDLKEGNNHLTGGQALAYSRIRAIGDGDFGRTERQRKVISALIEKCRNMNLSQLNKLMEEALPLLTTDLTNREILNYVVELLPILTNLKVNTQRIPADGTYQYAWIDEKSVLLPDLEANRELLTHCMAEE